MKSLKALIITMAVFTTGIFIQVNASELEKESIATASLTGSIVDLHTGEALAGVKIEMEETKDSFYTDLDGNFSVNNLQPGYYTLSTSLISYELKKVNLEVAASEVPEKIEIQLDTLK